MFILRMYIIIRKNLCLFFFLLLFCSCQTITIFLSGKNGMVIPSEPDYQKSHFSFLGGLIDSSASVNTSQLCNSKEVIQVQTQKTFWDGLWPYLSGAAGLMVGAVVGDAVAGYRTEKCKQTCHKRHCHCWGAFGIEALLGSIIGVLIGGLTFRTVTSKAWCSPEASQQSFLPDFENAVKQRVQ